MNVKPMILAFVLALAQTAAAAPPVDYVREVKPILTARCTSCHGAIRQKAGLRLDTAEFVRRGGDSGPAVEPGKSGESLLIDRVTGADGSDRMPPESEGVAAQRTARSPCFAPGSTRVPRPRRSRLPRTRASTGPTSLRFARAFRAPADAAWARNPIDAFLAAGYQSRGLRPSPPVSKDLWLRRVYLDLIGLPPTREELQAFLADGSADADERIVDRLLADPRHGERWGRHWMDVWRYSDWYGLGEEIRYSHPHIWQWRDWIVASLNADKGYDRMIEEMLAGDELAPDDPATVRATGFLVRNWDIFNRNAWLASTVEHTARAFLGVTIQCARCHDHKFDPISQADYYRLRAFFEPYHIRIDRVPGQPDRTKAGLSRAFDDFLETPTYLFVRGDEAAPDKTRPLRPATPAVLGGEVQIAPVLLSDTRRLPRQARVRHPRGGARRRRRRSPRPARPPRQRGTGPSKRTRHSPPPPRPTARPRRKSMPPPACRRCSRRRRPRPPRRSRRWPAPSGPPATPRKTGTSRSRPWPWPRQDGRP